MNALALAALLLLQAAGPVRLSAAPDSSALRFQVVHTLHQVNGESRSVEARASIDPDGRVVAMVRAPLDSFHSGNGNRDANMLEALEAAKHPFVIFKGVARLPGGADLAAPVTLPITIEGELDLRGARRKVEVPLTVEVGADGKVRVRGSFSFSLDSHGVERPSLLFVKIDDRCRIDLDLVLTPEGVPARAP